MPNLYVPPNIGFAAATQGFLSSFKDFRKLRDDELKRERDAAALDEAARRFDVTTRQRQEGLGIDLARETRLQLAEVRRAQDRQVMEAKAREELNKMRGTDSDFAETYTSLLDANAIDPASAYERARKHIDDVTYQARLEDRWSEVIDEARNHMKEFGPMTDDEREPLELMLKQMEVAPDEDPSGFRRDFNQSLMNIRQRRERGLAPGADLGSPMVFPPAPGEGPGPQRPPRQAPSAPPRNYGASPASRVLFPLIMKYLRSGKDAEVPKAVEEEIINLKDYEASIEGK